MNPELNKYIQDNLTRGVPKETIMQSLLSMGWQKNVIEASFPNPQAVEKPEAIIRGGKYDFLPSLFLRIGLAFVFLYAAIFVSHPSTGGKYVPQFVQSMVPLDLFLLVFGIFEIFLALWILTGKFKLYSGLIAAMMLAGITVFNFSLIGTLFRNVAIIGAALAFAFL